LASSHEPFAGRIRTHIPEPTHALDIQWIEFGKYLIAALVENGLHWWRHDAPLGTNNVS
jgi:hypothetical protein